MSNTEKPAWWIDLSMQVVAGCVVAAIAMVFCSIFIGGCLTAVVIQNKQQIQKLEKRADPVLKKAEAAKAKGEQ